MRNRYLGYKCTDEHFGCTATICLQSTLNLLAGMFVASLCAESKTCAVSMNVFCRVNISCKDFLLSILSYTLGLSVAVHSETWFHLRRIPITAF